MLHADRLNEIGDRQECESVMEPVAQVTCLPPTLVAPQVRVKVTHIHGQLNCRTHFCVLVSSIFASATSSLTSLHLLLGRLVSPRFLMLLQMTNPAAKHVPNLGTYSVFPHTMKQPGKWLHLISHSVSRRRVPTRTEEANLWGRKLS
jgi:hypothetical protein